VSTALRCASFFLLASVALLAQDAAPKLDYLFFKNQVQPIFLEKRIGHARCIACHTARSPVLQKLSPGAETWNDEQSRKNFEMWSLFVVPGEPMKSKFLLHPLAEEAGGDVFHGGGKHWDSTGNPEWQTLASWVNGRVDGAVAALPGSGSIRAFQSNSAGDDIHVIDPATNTVVGMIQGIEAPHGVAVAPNGERIYVTNEAESTLDVVDAKTLKVFKRIPLSGHPNNLDVAHDNSKVYVGIRQEPGAVDVIDAETLTNVKSIAVTGAIHNVYLTPDGSHLFAGSIPAKTITVIDAKRDEVAWTWPLDAGVRPMAFTRNGDGSTREIIVQLSDFHGVAVLDFATRKEKYRYEFPDAPGVERELEGLQGSPAHGLAVSSDQRTIWSTSKYYHAVYGFRLPKPNCGEPERGYRRPGAPEPPPPPPCEFELVGIVDVGSHPDWLGLTPDGKSLYVALAGDDETAVIDTEKMEVVARIAVGNVPKRLTVGEIQTH
jgi:YVTN family beta-propeller protein